MILNKTPVRTAKNYGINNIELNDVNLPNNIQEFNSFEITGDTSNFEISNNVIFKKLKFGISREFEELNNHKSNCNVKIDEIKSGNLFLEFNLNKENINLIENIEINAKSKLKTTITIKLISQDDLENFHNGIIKVNAQENSYTEIIIVNMLNNKSKNFISIENSLSKNSTVNYLIVDFGGKTSITNWYSNLQGNSSKSNINTIYLGNEEKLIDINYIAELYGEQAKTNIDVQGALKDNALKNFKGTIDFKKGCKKAVGDENEFCMLLSEKAKAKALPMLLCTEENIQGNHSTACGKIDDAQLFYLMSRGISYTDAMKLIIKARFNKTIQKIKDEILKEEILNQIDKRI